MISLCVTTYNRTQMLLESFERVLNDDRITEIVIVDDASDTQTVEYLSKLSIEKVRLFLNTQNIDCYRNKREAINYASNEMVIILDSDNIIEPSYIDAVENHIKEYGPDPKRIYQPSFAKPHFNFMKYSGMTIRKDNVAQHMSDPTFETMLNAMNYAVNRQEYLKVWDGSLNPVTSDSIYQNYRWLDAGNSIMVCAGMHYEHRVHQGSHYTNNVKRTPRGFHQDIVNRLKQMK